MKELREKIDQIFCEVETLSLYEPEFIAGCAIAMLHSIFKMMPVSEKTFPSKNPKLVKAMIDLQDAVKRVAEEQPHPDEISH